MWRRTSRTDPKLPRCSFCRKSEDAVAKLLSGPSDYSSVFICDECVAVDAVERWITKDSAGEDAAREFEQMRRWATCLIPNSDMPESHPND